MTMERTFPVSGLFHGKVVHRRFSPKKHKLNYRIFSLFVDLDSIGELCKKTWMLSFNKFNLISFYEKDYGDTRGNLKAYIINQVKTRFPNIKIDKIYLLTMPRILGYVFNPLSVYFCYDQYHSLTAVLYEVTNTFGQRHNYIFDVSESKPPIYRHECRKDFYVSPFLEMDLKYKFAVSNPAPVFSLAIHAYKNSDLIVSASQTMTFAELSARNLTGVFTSIPFMTIKVIAGIHLEAFILWLKGVVIVPNTSPGIKAIRYSRNQKR
jgi:DUF1365 family protein